MTLQISLNIASGLLLCGGGFFILVGGIGVLRMPDLYTRMHAASLTDSLAPILIIGGFVALGLIVVSVLFKISLGLWFSLAMVVFAGASIIYEASKMDQRYSEDQYVAASL